jgi:hypothetical protein
MRHTGEHIEERSKSLGYPWLRIVGGQRLQEVEWRDTVMGNERVRAGSNTDFEVEGTVGQGTRVVEEDGKEKESDL